MGLHRFWSEARLVSEPPAGEHCIGQVLIVEAQG